MQFTRQIVAGTLRRTGMPELADRALRELPEVVSEDEVAVWCEKVGISMDELVSKMGGSP